MFNPSANAVLRRIRNEMEYEFGVCNEMNPPRHALCISILASVPSVKMKNSTI